MYMRTDREKADEAEIPGPYKDLAVEVRKMLGYYSDDLPLLSARQAALKSGVNHSTIASLIRGGRASRISLKQLAETFGIDAARLLRLAGYALESSETVLTEPGAPELVALTVPDGLPERIYHRIERLTERDLRRLDQVLELWVDDGHEIGR
jgi:transcriptional regulator with XRE-family HTH domain